MKMNAKTAVMLILAALLETAIARDADSLRYLEPGDTVDYVPLSDRRSFRRPLYLYCYRGGNKTLARLFETIQLSIEFNGDYYMQYSVSAPEVVHKNSNNGRSHSRWGPSTKNYEIPSFIERCIGIESVEPYRVHLRQIQVDYVRVAQLTFGVVLFVSAERFKPIFQYTFLFVVLIFGFPSAAICCLCLILKTGLLVRICLSIATMSINIYYLAIVWRNPSITLETHGIYVYCFMIIICSLTSLHILYKDNAIPQYQPNKLIEKWMFRLISMVLILNSSNLKEATTIILVILMFRNWIYRKFFKF